MTPEEQLKEARKLFDDAKKAVNLGAITGLAMSMALYYKRKAETEKTKDGILVIIMMIVLGFGVYLFGQVLADIWNWLWHLIPSTF